MFREMVRKNKQLPQEECIRILTDAPRGVLSVIGDGGYPYGVPMDHWYNPEDGCLYFHSGSAGHKIDAIRSCDKASFCVMDSGYREEGDWALNIRSVIVFGRMEVVDDMDTIVDVTTRLSHKFTLDDDYIQKEIRQSAKGTLLLRLTPEHICGKRIKES